jgi:hypothetical protein
VFHLKDIFVVGSGFKVDEEHRERELGAILRDVPDVGDLVAELFNFGLDVSSWYRVMHILEDNLVGTVFLRFVGMEFHLFSG